MSPTIKLQAAPKGVAEAVVRQSPKSIGGLKFNPDKPWWTVGFYNPMTGIAVTCDPRDLEGFVPFFVSNAGAPNPEHIGKHGVATVGTYPKENNSVLFNLGEYSGGGGGIIYYTFINRELYFGVISEARIRKEFAKTLAAPRGYADIENMAKEIRGQLLDLQAATGAREGTEEAAHVDYLVAKPIKFSNGVSAKTDQNGAVFKCAPGEGFGYSQMEWPADLLIEHPEFDDVYIPDMDNPAVKPATDKEGAKEHGHTQLYFVPWYMALDPNAIEGLEATAPFDGLGAGGMFMLMSELSRANKIALISASNVQLGKQKSK